MVPISDEQIDAVARWAAARSELVRRGGDFGVARDYFAAAIRGGLDYLRGREAIDRPLPPAAPRIALSLGFGSEDDRWIGFFGDTVVALRGCGPEVDEVIEPPGSWRDRPALL